MPRRCSICHHERSEEINRALVGSTALSEIAALFRVSDDALSRHKVNHLPAALAKAEKARETAQAEDLLSELRGLQTRTVAILEAAETSGEHRTALAAIGEARRNLELLGKLAGELDERPVTNVLMTPEWLELRAVIVGVLKPHPRAREAVLGALEGMGKGGSTSR